LKLPSDENPNPPENWSLADGDESQLTPARMVAWDRLAEGARRNLSMDRWSEVVEIQAKAASWCVSFEGEFMGYVVLDVEAPAGSILDVACDDWQTEEGAVALYRSNPFTDSADRFVLRGGRQQVELFHPRGGKYLQVTLRSSTGIAPLALHEIKVRSRQRAIADLTEFESDSEVLNWLWPVAFRTLVSSTDETYADCPWRERASYIGDCYVNLHLDSVLTGDRRTSRRTLREFALARLPNGQLACCAPAWLRKAHEDYTLIWILALRDYWALRGDSEIVEEVWPTVQGIWASPTWQEHSSGLWSLHGADPFIDWGVLPSERSGPGNAVINLFRLGALKASTELAIAVERGQEAVTFEREARRLEANLFQFLWKEEEGRFLASLGATTPALHANVLALAFQAGSAQQRSRILDYLEPRLLQNLEKGLADGQFSGHLELYFLHYLLPALAEHGRPGLAESLIDSHYGYLQSLGDDTLPECFCRVEQAVGSRCHSWSGAGAIYAARYVLGIRPATPGNPNHLLCAPVVDRITRASGRIAHPDGWITVSWQKDRNGGVPEVSAPRGVLVEIPKPSTVLNSSDLIRDYAALS
jgi:hypothetical protein